MIYDVYKKSRRDKSGQRVFSRYYYLRLKLDGMLSEKSFSLKTDNKEIAWEKARDIKIKKERVLNGLIEPEIIQRAAKTSLKKHLHNYLQDLATRNRDGRNGRGGRQQDYRISRLLSECKWETIGSVTPASFVAWRNLNSDLSARTKNHFLQTMCTFLNWLERNGYSSNNPLKKVQKVDERGKRTYQRRAFTDDELLNLIQNTGERGIVYFTAARSGLRWNELKELQWGDVRLDEKLPRIIVRVDSAKNKCEEPVPLIPELREQLLNYRPATWKPSDKVFKNVPRCRRLHKDCIACGISIINDEGKHLKFHSLRDTWVTFLQRNGIPQRLAMAFSRHKDPNLTAKIYTDDGQLPIYSVAANLPSLLPTQKGAHIGAQIQGQAGAHKSTGGNSEMVKSASATCSKVASCHKKSGGVQKSQLERVKGIEPS